MPSASETPGVVPHLPFLAFAPLDTWWRLLFRPKAHIARRYLLRVAFGLVVSGIITVLTLPERLLVGLWLRLGAGKRLPGPVIILGYYRSGTTHLQFLLSRDPNLRSPRWTQTLSPQGFAVSWSLLNWFLLPLFPDKRPQDNAAFGSDIPAEDDFALANAALASSLIGRHVLPELRDHYDRYHDLTRLTPEEVDRWRRAQLTFVRKIGLLGRTRRVLLKTPSHTARVEQLLALFGDDVRFIHISRKPDAVFRSNVGLHRVLNERYHLQDGLPEEEIERRIVEEYLGTEQNYLAAKEKIPAGRLTELRMEDLMADPVGQIQRMYAELGLPYTDEFEQRLLEYLDASKTYEPNVHKEKGADEARRLEPLAPLKTTFGHDRPAVAKQEPAVPRSLQPGERGKRLLQGAGGALAAILLSLLVAVGLTWLLGLRLDGLGWLAGIAAGTAAIQLARRGSPGLGLWSAGVTLVGQLALALFTTRLLAGEPQSFGDLMQGTFATLQTPFILFWFVLGTLGAYRLATRRWI